MFNNQDVIASAKPSAVATAMDAIQRCKKSFEEIGEEIEKAQKYNGLSFPFRAGNLKKLSDGLESYKSTLMLLMLILQHSKEMRTDQELRAQAKEYLRIKSEAENRMRQAAREGDAEQEEDAGLAEDVSGKNRSIPRTCQESHKIQGETKAVSNQIDTTSAKDHEELPVARELLQTINHTILVATPAAPQPRSNRATVATIKDDTPTNRDSTAQTSQCVTEAQLADCIEGLKDMIRKIELLQQALPTKYPMSKCLEDNRIPEAASDVKKKLDTIVDSCKQQHQAEFPIENAEIDRSEPVGRDTRTRKVLRRLQHRSRSIWSFFNRRKEIDSIVETSCIAMPVRMSHPDGISLVCAPPTVCAAEGVEADARDDETARNDEASKYSVDTEEQRRRLNSALVAKYRHHLHQIHREAMEGSQNAGASQGANFIPFFEAFDGREVDALLKEWTTVYD